MALRPPPAYQASKSYLHEVALPERGDGIARALQISYPPKHGRLPADMLRLLAEIDAPRNN